MATKIDSRQIISRDLLAKLTNASNSELDNILRALDLEVTSPLNMRASNTPDLTISVGPAIVTNPETNAKKSIPHVGSLLPNDFTAGTIEFTTPGGAVNISPGINNTIAPMASNEFLKVTIYIDPNGDLNVLSADPATLEADTLALPAPRGTLPLGYVLLQEDGSGGLNVIEQGDIFQFGTGAGGSGGAGDAFNFEERVLDRVQDSLFETARVYIAEREEEILIDPSSTGEFDLVSSKFLLENIGDTLVSTELLDDEFIASDNGLSNVEVLLKFDEEGIDDLSTVEVSRNGGNEYQAVNVERLRDTNIFRGFHAFDPEASNQTISEITTNTGTSTLSSATQSLAQLITITNKTVVRSWTLEITPGGPGVDGSIAARIVKDDGSGFPSTDPVDIVTETSLVSAPTTAGSFTFNFNDTILQPDDYHLVILGDAFFYGGDSLLINSDTGQVGGSVFGSGPWSALGGGLQYTLEGYEPSLRLRITGGTAEALIEGFAVLFEESLGNLAFPTTSDGITKVSFNAVADNLNSFAMPFNVNPDLLVVHLIGSGQSFRFGDFGLQGNTVVFPTDQFNNGGFERVQTLIFDQARGGAFDNSDVNATLLGTNHLGSTDPAVDRSLPGRGIFLRRPDGTLRELTIDDNDNITIYSVD